jgi:hypothetical protein
MFISTGHGSWGCLFQQVTVHGDVYFNRSQFMGMLISTGHGSYHVISVTAHVSWGSQFKQHTDRLD